MMIKTDCEHRCDLQAKWKYKTQMTKTHFPRMRCMCCAKKTKEPWWRGENIKANPNPVRKTRCKSETGTLWRACTCWARCRKTCVFFSFESCDFVSGDYRVSGSQSKEGSIVEKSNTDDRRMSTCPRLMNADGFRRFSCRQESHRPPGVLTRPRQPRGWFTHEYILKA